MKPPKTQYTKVGEAWVGYQVVGDGPIDLVLVAGLASNVETMWDFPLYARMLERLASYTRLIVFDARGSGVSDPIQFEALSTWEHWTEDLVAVLDATGSERTALLGLYDGSWRAILFAATHPSRTTALVLWNGYARFNIAEDYPIGWTEEQHIVQSQSMEQLWGSEEMMPAIDPSLAGDAEHVAWGAKYLRTTMTPRAAAAQSMYMGGIDVRSVLPAVRVPCLVMHRRENNFIPVEFGRYIADHVPGARFVEVPGGDLNIFASDGDAIQDEIEEFLTGTRRAPDSDRVLATLLFTDIVDSTGHAASIGDRKWKELLSKHDKAARAEVERQRGRLVSTTGDGMLATFDGPGRAIRCAHALGRALEKENISIRAGLHTGEIELRDEGNVGGIAVHIAARVMAEAGPSDVFCSRTVKDLVAGSEFAFDDKGIRPLKGVPDEWQLYAVRQT